MSSVLNLIKEEANKGRFSCDDYENLVFGVKEKFIEMGYQISEPKQSGPNEQCITISW